MASINRGDGHFVYRRSIILLGLSGLGLGCLAAGIASLKLIGATRWASTVTRVEIWRLAASVAATVLILAASLAHGQEIATSDPALICGKVDGMSYSRQHRALLLEDDRQADFARWGVPWSDHHNWQLDHVIPLALGGADTPANRRPQHCTAWRGIECIAGPAADKDKVEWQAAHAVCHAKVDQVNLLKSWQGIFARWGDWR